ncbi:hypothetical protein [Escherichia phage vB_EcoM_IME392]|nr:hypothetical protein [Escherichia phage vB_EcoM_IME392]
MKSRLIISPHHDDEILGCGGIMSKFRDDQFFILEVTAPDETRRGEAEAAFGVYPNIKEVHCLERNDASTGDGMTQKDIPQLAKDIADYVAKIRPDVVYIPFSSLHQDHQLVNHAARVALRAYNWLILEYEYAESLTQFGQMEPNYFERLNKDDIECKCQAMGRFDSQIKSDRDTQSILALATLRGYSAQWPYAEGFRLVRQIG